MTVSEEQVLIEEAVKKFPDTFVLRAWPDNVFRINKRQSYVRSGDQVVLCVDIQTPDGWRNFFTGTPWEVEREVVLTYRTTLVRGRLENVVYEDKSAPRAASRRYALKDLHGQSTTVEQVGDREWRVDASHYYTRK